MSYTDWERDVCIQCLLRFRGPHGHALAASLHSPMARAVSPKCISKMHGYLFAIPLVIYKAVHFQLTNLSCNDCANMCTLSYHHQIWSMNHLKLFRARSQNTGMHCVTFYFSSGSENGVSSKLIKIHWFQLLKMNDVIIQISKGNKVENSFVLFVILQDRMLFSRHIDQPALVEYQFGSWAVLNVNHAISNAPPAARL